jgi:hypothetical protein
MGSPSPEGSGCLPAGKILERAVLSNHEGEQDDDEQTLDQLGQIQVFHRAPPIVVWT